MILKYPKYRIALKAELESLMGDSMTDEEFSPFAKLSINDMRSSVISQKNFSEGMFENFLNKGAHIAFTPKAVIVLVNLIIKHKGNSVWERSGKFKRMRELSLAIRLLLIIKKISGKELLIESSDSQNGEADIRIIHREKMFSTKLEKFPLLEVMRLLHRDVIGFKGEDLIKQVALVIEDRKFNRDYGPNTDLLIHFDFTAKGFDNKKLSQFVNNSKKKNPFKNIWITGWTSPDYKNYVGVKIFPELQIVPMNYEEKLKLIY
jgi:hypothetical protein